MSVINVRSYCYKEIADNLEHVCDPWYPKQLNRAFAGILERLDARHPLVGHRIGCSWSG